LAGRWKITREFFVKSRMILSTVVLTVALALAPAAVADNSSVGTYAGQGGEVAGSVASGGGAGADPGETANSSALPFTGLDLELLAGGGLLLLLGGFGMARMAARREDTV
jgi:hypothetical protein